MSSRIQTSGPILPIPQWKMRLYSAAAVMTGPDRARLHGMIAADGMIAAVGTNTQPALAETSESTYTALQDGSQSLRLLAGPETPERPPTGPCSSAVQPASPVRTPPSRTPQPGTIKLVPDTRPRKAATRGRVHPKASVESRVRAAYVPGMSVNELER